MTKYTLTDDDLKKIDDLDTQLDAIVSLLEDPSGEERWRVELFSLLDPIRDRLNDWLYNDVRDKCEQTPGQAAVPDTVLFERKDLVRINQIGDFFKAMAEHTGYSAKLRGYIGFCDGFEEQFEYAAENQAELADGAKDDAAAPEGGAE